MAQFRFCSYACQVRRSRPTEPVYVTHRPYAMEDRGADSALRSSVPSMQAIRFVGSALSRHIRRFSAILACPVVGLSVIACSSNTNVTPRATPTATAPTASDQRPCDLYASATPCVAAFSTTRALYVAYAGALYQVTRQSDSTTMEIGLLSDGYANAASQDSFCASTMCTISKIYDQSPDHNDLTVAPPGGAATGAGPGGYDLPAVATTLPIAAGGHKVYGIAIVPGMGYRNDTTTNIATGAQPQGVYMVTSALKINVRCCFDFGNAETSNTDTLAGHMDAINIICRGGTPCGDQAGLDLENGIYGSLPVIKRTAFVTDMGANDGQQYYTIWQGNAQAGALTTTGPTRLPPRYSPMKQEGAIILGIGGDNSDGAAGYFFEGVMTQGTPADAVMNSVQRNIVAAAYTGL